jgi:GAF domain-containing protein
VPRKPIADVPDSASSAGGVNRLYRVLSRVNEAIVRIREPQELYEEACRIAVEDGRFLLAWVGFTEPGSDEIHPVASFGHDDGYLDLVRLSLSADAPEGQGPTGIALREGCAFINNDTANNPIMRPWRDEQLKRGFRSSASFPLKNGAETVGVMTLYAGETDFFDEEEVGLLTALADDFSFALRAGVAIENARLIESERIQATRMQALSEIGRMVTSSLDVDAVVDRSLEQVVSQLGVSAASLWIVEDGERLILRGARGFGDAFFADFAEGLPLDAPYDVARAFNSGESIVHEDAAVSDVATPVREAYARYGLPLGSLVALPLRSPSGVVGALTLAWDRARSFTDADLAFDVLLADTFAIGLQNARLFEAERAAQQVAIGELAATNTLLEAANELNRWTDLQCLLDALVTLVVRLIPDSRVNIGIAAPDRSSMTMAAGGGQRPFPSGAVVPWDRLTSGSRGTLESGRTSISDFEQLGEGGIAKEYGSRLALFVALRFADRVVGQIGVDVPGERHEFTTREIALLEGMASQAAVAIENARMFGDRRDQAQRAEVLKELAEIGVAGASVSDVAERQAQAIIGLLGASHAAVVLSDGERLQPVALVGYPDDYVEKLTPLPEDALAAQAFQSGRPRFVDDLHVADTSEFTKAVSSDLGFGSFAALPLGPPEAPIGAVGFVWRDARRFDRDEVAFLEAVASELAVGLSNQQAQDSVRESARLSDALNIANAAVHSTLDIDQVMQSALETGARALGCDAGSVEMLEGDEWVVRHQSGFALSDIGTRLSKEQAPNATSALLQAAPLAIADLQADTGRNVGFVKQYGLKSVLAVPLNVKGQPIGCALFYSAGSIKHFTDAEVDFGRKLGSSVSLALENARLYGTERNISNVLQSALLTLPASVPGLEFASAYSSATEATNVGGDFYDIFELDERYVGVTIGDVSGKGLEAAVLTSLIRNSIRAYASEGGMGPSKVLSQANQIVHKSTPSEIFATVFFAMFDRRDGRLLYASAGHPAAAVVKADGSSAHLSATGPLLGAFPGMRFEEREACLGPDDLLFLYTDGLTEARRDRELYGEDRLFEFLSTGRSTVPRLVIEAVLADVGSFGGDRLRDDLAILAVRRVVA